MSNNLSNVTVFVLLSVNVQKKNCVNPFTACLAFSVAGINCESHPNVCFKRSISLKYFKTRLNSKAKNNKSKSKS